MKILVDADACPVKNIITKIAKKNYIPVIMFVCTANEIKDEYSQVRTVDKGADSVDFALVSECKPEDIVVTQDYGLAAMALGKKAFVIHPNGFYYSNENIERLLMERHIGAKNRKAGIRTKGPAKRTSKNNEDFEIAFSNLLNKALVPKIF